MDAALKHVSRLPSSAFADEARRSVLSYCKLTLKEGFEALKDWKSDLSEDSRWSLWQAIKKTDALFLFYEGQRIGAFVSSLKAFVHDDAIHFTALKQVNRNSLVTAASHYAVSEQSRVNLGQEDAFIASITEQWSEDKEDRTDPKLVDLQARPSTIDIFQDRTDSRNFLVIYYFVDERNIRILRESKAWICWRRSLAGILEGTPSVVVMRSALNYLTPRESEVTVRRQNDQTPEAPHHPAQFSLARSKDVVNNLTLLSKDLLPFADFIRARFEKYVETYERENDKSTRVCTTNYLPKRTERGSVYFRERYPGVRGLALVGEFSNWTERHWFRNIQGTPDWELEVENMPEGTLYKLMIQREDESEDYTMSPWTTSFKLHEDLVANSKLRTCLSAGKLRPLKLARAEVATTRPRLYQVHVGCCTEEERIGSYDDVRTSVLPYMVATGFDVLVLMGVQEHTYYPDGGWQVDSPISVCQSFGTPESFSQLVACAHAAKIRVCIQFVLSHLSSGINSISHLPGLCEGSAANKSLVTHPEWDGYIIDYGSATACEYMVSAAEFWMERYGVDGFWFEGCPSICYTDKAVNRFFDRFKFETYFESNADMSGQAFLMHLTERLREKFMRLVEPETDEWSEPLLLANDYIGMPGLAGGVEIGGLGFTHVVISDTERVLANYERLSVEALTFGLDRRTSERRVSGTDSWASALVGKRALHIAFFAWETLHTIAVGGIAPHVTELAAALRRVGHEVHIFARATSEHSVTRVVHGVFYHEVPFQLDRDFVRECEHMCEAFVAQLLAYEALVGWQFDVCHGHDWLTAHAVQRLTALGRVTVFTMHSTESGRCGNQTFGGVSERIRQLEHAGCHSARRVICVSGVLADEVKTLYNVHSEKIRVTYNGCNVENFEGFEDAAPIKQQLQIAVLEPTILFVGRFVVQKGVDELVEAVPAILQFRADAKFVIVGDGHMRAEVERRAAQLGVAHACRFVGAKSGAELRSLFKMADAVIVPSRNEPFGIVVLEAWACYKPVIATTHGGPRDFVTPFADGLLVEPTRASIAWGVCEALSDFARLRRWGEEGNRKVKANFSWRTIGQQTKNIYFELLNLADCGYAPRPSAGGAAAATLAQRLAGAALQEHMAVFDSAAQPGLTKLRLALLLTHALAADALLTLQGSEFAHPDYIDLPRPGNHFSLARARTLTSLPFRRDLQFKHHLYYSLALARLLRPAKASDADQLFVIGMYERVLQLERGDLLFIFNLDDSRSYESYEVCHRFGGRPLRIVLHTDLLVYGGWERVPESMRPGCSVKSDEEGRICLPVLPCKFACVLSADLARPTQDGAADIDLFLDDLRQDMERAAAAGEAPTAAVAAAAFEAATSAVEGVI